jgi:hypothetical protein
MVRDDSHIGRALHRIRLSASSLTIGKDCLIEGGRWPSKNHDHPCPIISKGPANVSFESLTNIVSYPIVSFDTLFHDGLSYITRRRNRWTKSKRRHVNIADHRVYKPPWYLLIIVGFPYLKTCSWVVCSPPTQSYVNVSDFVPVFMVIWLLGEKE